MKYPAACRPGVATTAKSDTPEKVHDAAQLIEALLMGQILQSARQSGSRVKTRRWRGLLRRIPPIMRNSSSHTTTFIYTTAARESK